MRIVEFSADKKLKRKVNLQTDLSMYVHSFIIISHINLLPVSILMTLNHGRCRHASPCTSWSPFSSPWALRGDSDETCDSLTRGLVSVHYITAALQTNRAWWCSHEDKTNRPTSVSGTSQRAVPGAESVPLSKQPLWCVNRVGGDLDVTDLLQGNQKYHGQHKALGVFLSGCCVKHWHCIYIEWGVRGAETLILNVPTTTQTKNKGTDISLM